MNIVKLFLTALLLCASLAAAETPDSLYQTGLTLLQQVANGNADKTVPAAKAFAEASLLYEKAGNDEGARSANANLYWVKKRMTLAQIDAFVGKASAEPVAKKIEAITQPVETDAAQKYFDHAEAFAKSSATSYLLISIRYFEVADRFVGTPIAVEAQRRSLDAMQKIKITGFSSSQRAIPLSIAESEYKRALAAAANDFEKAKTLAAHKLALSVAAAQEEAAKRGDLDTAVKLRQRLKRVQTASPKTIEDLKEFLDGTSWDIHNNKLDSPVAYTLTFHKNGSYSDNDGHIKQAEFLGPRSILLWQGASAIFNEDLDQFSGSAGIVFFGTAHE